MAKFNSPSKGKNLVQNKEGGLAYKLSFKRELIGKVLTSFVEDKFYVSTQEQTGWVKEYVKKLSDPDFVFKLAIYARTRFNMRSISHVIAGEAIDALGYDPAYLKGFFQEVIVRPDDILEIASYRKRIHGSLKPLPNSMKRGFSAAIKGFDTYQLSKYQGKDRDISMVDIINLVHPRPNKKNEEALSSIIKGGLASQSFKGSIGKAMKGVDVKDEKEVAKAKEKAWTEQIRDNKLSFWALIQNLSNISKNIKDVELLEKVRIMLIDPIRIKNSRVLPFHILRVIKNLKNRPECSCFIGPLSEALEISVDNCPRLKGETCVVFDTSGSMQGQSGDFGSLFAAIFLKANPDADLLLFDCDGASYSLGSRYFNVNTRDSLSTIAQILRRQVRSRGTDFCCIFKALNRQYNNIIIISDEQGWYGSNRLPPTKPLARYKETFQCNPYIFVFDVAGEGTIQFPENEVFILSGYSTHIFDVMKALCVDKEAMIKEIEAITF